jgi:DNA-binding NtrC family response regulator
VESRTQTFKRRRWQAWGSFISRTTLLTPRWPPSPSLPNSPISTVTDRGVFLSRLAAELSDLILSDFSLPAFSGLEALALAHARPPAIPFVFLSGTIDGERALEAVRAGAYDYVLKNNLTRLPVVVRRALGEYANRRLAKWNHRPVRFALELKS